MDKNAKIYVAGSTGLVGSAILRALERQGFRHVIKAPSSRLNLRRQDDVENFFVAEKPEFVFLAAAKVGGILANDTYRAEFLYDNLMISANVIHASYRHGVKKLLNLGSSCIYPRDCPQPMKESSLLTGALEKTNEPYALAKIAALKMVENYNRQYGTNFISLMPTNLYGPNDNFDLDGGHVLPALIRRFYEAELSGADSVTLWGSGSPQREFLHVDDLAEACLFAMEKHKAGDDPGDFVNVGSGVDLSIKELAEKISAIVGYQGKIQWDTSKPDGTPKKLLDVSQMNQRGWKARISLDEGLKSTFEWYRTQHSK